MRFSRALHCMTAIAIGLLSAPGWAADVSPVTHAVTVEAPIDKAWDAFTTKEGIESWMVPHAEIDMKVGGEMRTNYNPDGVIGDKGTIVNRILSYQPQRMMSI